MTQGGTPPTITATISGWVNGDTDASLTHAPTCSTTATSASSVGSYPSSCTGAAAPANYTISYVDGNVTVTPALVAVLALTKSANLSSFSQVDQSIIYTYTVVNAGTENVGPAQFTVSDDKISGGTPFNCGAADTTLTTNAGTLAAPSAGSFVICTATYQVTQADLTLGSITNRATASGGGASSTSVSVTIAAAKLTVTKTPSRTTYDAAGQVITYSYTLHNTGGVALHGPFSVTDDPLGEIACTGDSLAPGAVLTSCNSATYTTTQADLDAGKTITDTAIGHGFIDLFAGKTAPNIATGDGYPALETRVDSGIIKVDVTVLRSTGLSLVKAAKQTTFTKAGDTIDYTYTLTNDGTATLDGPFTVTDDKIADVACPATPDGLAAGQSIVCTATYTVTPSDMDAKKVVNTASGHGHFGTTVVDSGPQMVTVTLKPLQSVLEATATPSQSVGSITATPRRAVTPPPTTVSDGSSGDSPTPLFAFLICLAFGVLGLLTVQTQRRSLRR
jgi:hypothetical protein